MRLKMKQRRLDLGLSQEKVAKMAGMSRSKYAKIEAGACRLSVEQAEKIAKALQIQFDGSFFAKDGSVSEQDQRGE